MSVLQRIEHTIDNAESTLVNLVAKCAPWLAPLPSAWLVHHKTITLLHFPVFVAWIAAAVIEVLGLASVSTALTLREYNATRRKKPSDWAPGKNKDGSPKKYRGKVDPEAPFSLALALVTIYFVSVILLTVVLELVPQVSTLALVIFPFLSLTGATVLALRADHRRRLEAIAGKPKSAQTSAQKGTVAQVQPGAQESAQNVQVAYRESTLDQVNRTRQAQKEQLLSALESAYQDNPDLGATEAGRRLGIHRNTVYNYRRELVAAGRIGDNGTGTK